MSGNFKPNSLDKLKVNIWIHSRVTFCRVQRSNREGNTVYSTHTVRTKEPLYKLIFNDELINIAYLFSVSLNKI